MGKLREKTFIKLNLLGNRNVSLKNNKGIFREQVDLVTFQKFVLSVALCGDLNDIKIIKIKNALMIYDAFIVLKIFFFFRKRTVKIVTKMAIP